MYIYNFTKRIDWPDDQKNGNFIMGVMGKGNIVKHLKGFTQNKKVISQPIEVRQFQSADAIDTCHLLFITDRYEDKTPVLVKKYADMPVLIITETSDSGEILILWKPKRHCFFRLTLNPSGVKI
ncbi:MAG: YfiR family protein [Bacteroidales bacterium]|nr:YfiR family protein [Bacteroidales bacterium]